MKVGIVLSGGGIRGIAHLGILKALQKTGIKFSHIVGTVPALLLAHFMPRV